MKNTARSCLRLSLCLLLLGSAPLARADDASHLRLKDLQALPEVHAVLDPSIKMLWHDMPEPEVAEATPEARFSATGVSLIPFNTSDRHCEEAFRRALESMISDARKGGYDLIYDIRPALREGPSSRLDTVVCTLSPVSARVHLSARLGMSQAARARAEATDREAERLAALSARPAAKGAIYIALTPILQSAEVQTLLGSDISLYPGSQKPPAYTQRFGPNTYSESASGDNLLPEEACKQATLATLRSMIKDARDHKYTAVIRVRSTLNGKLPPSPNDVECEMGSRSAKARLSGVLIVK